MSSRPLLIGDPSGPSAPFPLRMSGPVIAGFGRGSKELGIPTANIPVDTPDENRPDQWLNSTPSGVYFGYASLQLPSTHPDFLGQKNWQIYPMVMSIGYNPFYKNTVRSAEVHILYKFAADFYGAQMRLLIMGYIREEKDYSGLEALIEDINFDCEVAKASLGREGWKVEGFKGGVWLVGESEEQDDKKGEGEVKL
ncbi:riboflavin kinase [Podospora fimiseda]|uniref:Riboflavin kinase n=1 Tax=Podospora fimiseda TaxID=252190 RepID=A0AAN7BDV4_9PEZI|nr:riboflavin kinase [Podospora fimiseda]